LEFELNTFLKRLDSEGVKLLILFDEKTVFSSSKDGMFPLLEAIETTNISRQSGAIIVDKMVGKAAALLICILGAEKVYTKIMSRKAMKVLDDNSIKYYAEETIPEIMNKYGTDICPFEKTVTDTNNPKEAYKKLKELATKLNMK
jgi:hypothetical protein